MWWPKLTGCATCRCVKPGRMTSAFASARSTSASCSAPEQRADGVDLVAQPQPHVGRHLVVARAAGVQPLAGVADALRQARLDVEVHVLELELPLERAGLDLGGDLRPGLRRSSDGPRARGCLAPPASRRAPGCRRCRPSTAGGRSRRWPCSASPARSSARKTGPTRRWTWRRVGCWTWCAERRRDGGRAARSWRQCAGTEANDSIGAHCDAHDAVPTRTAQSAASGGASDSRGRRPRDPVDGRPSAFGSTGFGLASAGGAAARRAERTGLGVRHVPRRRRAARGAVRARGAGARRAVRRGGFEQWLTPARARLRRRAAGRAAVAGAVVPAEGSAGARCPTPRSGPRRSALGAACAAALLGAAGGVGLGLLADGHAFARAAGWRRRSSGAALAAALFYWLRLRAIAQGPADTSARLAELQSRIRPHFLFNTLNTAITLARVDPARTEESARGPGRAVSRRARRHRTRPSRSAPKSSSRSATWRSSRSASASACG